jgi:S1-C subfamily serine protease
MAIVIAYPMASHAMMSSHQKRGDVINGKLIYDGPTAHGGSGGPVFNTRGEVIGVNFAYMDGFSGATLGISVESLRPLLQELLCLRAHSSEVAYADDRKPLSSSCASTDR